MTNVPRVPPELVVSFSILLKIPLTWTTPKSASAHILYLPFETYLTPELGIIHHASQDDFPALQLLNSNNEWIQATPIKGTFMINVADSLMRWTNDHFQSTVHRAINISGKERFSIPIFWGADDDKRIKPLES